MTKEGVVISDVDDMRIRGTIRSAERRGTEGKHVIEKLQAVLNRATVLRSSSIPHDRVTVNSRVRLLDAASGNEEEVWLRFGCDTQGFVPSCPVISELGVALLGSRLGETIEWRAATGKRRSEIKQIVYQPERLRGY